MTPQKWGVIFNYNYTFPNNYIFPKTLLIRLAVKREERAVYYIIYLSR